MVTQERGLKMKPNDFIKWTAHDEQGQFSYIGQVVAIDDSTVQMVTSERLNITVAIDDGCFTTTSKPQNWDDHTIIPQPTPPTVTSHKRTTCKSSGGGKLQQVVDLLKSNPTLVQNRKQAIQAIVDAGISTQAGASTWFSNAKNKLAHC